MKLAVPDLISPSYFPAAAAVELGCFREEGLDVSLELVYPVDACYRRMRDGEIDFVAGSAHSALAAYPEWQGAKLLAAQGQGMYWFLVAHRDLGLKRGELAGLKGHSVGAAPWVDYGLRQLLIAAGLDPAREDIRIGPVPGAQGHGVNFGLAAAKALEEKRIDAFWANGMAAELAVTGGWGTLILDIRRGDGPKEAFNYTMASLATSDALIAREPEAAKGAIRALVKAQRALSEDPDRATKIAQKLFPPHEAGLIAALIRRDAPFYDPAIKPEFVAAMNRFARAQGVLKGDPPYAQVVATEFSALWKR